MGKLFLRQDDRTFTVNVARGRFLWLVVAALLLPLAASLSHNAQHSEHAEAFLQDGQ